MRLALTCLILCLLARPLAAGVSPRASDVKARAARAQKVVVGTVVDVQPRFDVNEHGDRLIVSDVHLRVDDVLKGVPAPSVTVEIEGGTVGDLTLRVSDMPVMRKGARGVFLLDAARDGRFKPHARGLGILALDASGRVQGSDVTLEELTRVVKGGR